MGLSTQMFLRSECLLCCEWHPYSHWTPLLSAGLNWVSLDAHLLSHSTPQAHPGSSGPLRCTGSTGLTCLIFKHHAPGKEKQPEATAGVGVKVISQVLVPDRLFWDCSVLKADLNLVLGMCGGHPLVLTSWETRGWVIEHRYS